MGKTKEGSSYCSNDHTERQQLINLILDEHDDASLKPLLAAVKSYEDLKLTY